MQALNFEDQKGLIATNMSMLQDIRIELRDLLELELSVLLQVFGCDPLQVDKLKALAINIREGVEWVLDEIDKLFVNFRCGDYFSFLTILGRINEKPMYISYIYQNLKKYTHNISTCTNLQQEFDALRQNMGLL